LKQIRYLSKLVDTHEIEVVHAYFETGLILAAGAKIFRPGLRAVASFVGFPGPSNYMRRLLLRMLSRNLDHVIYVSRFTKASFEGTYDFLKKVPSTVIYNGVKPRRALHPIVTDGAGHLRLVTVSGLVPFKNVEVLLETLVFLRPMNVRLVIVGDGPLRASLEESAARLGVSDLVKFVGYQDDIGSYLAASQIYLHPSLTEGFGLAVVEAMHHGIPVVVAKAGALPELVEDEVTGLVVDPNDARAWADSIIRLSSDRALATKLAKAGQARAKREFSLDRFVQEHEVLYRSLLASV
jgi:glycosyltransferase involved in cell wall biosynthesis